MSLHGEWRHSSRKPTHSHYPHELLANLWWGSLLSFCLNEEWRERNEHCFPGIIIRDEVVLWSSEFGGVASGIHDPAQGPCIAVQAESGGGAEPRKNIHVLCGGPDGVLHVVSLIKFIRLSSKGIIASIQLHKDILALYCALPYSRLLAVDRDCFQGALKRHRYGDTVLQQLTKEKVQWSIF